MRKRRFLAAIMRSKRLAVTAVLPAFGESHRARRVLNFDMRVEMIAEDLPHRHIDPLGSLGPEECGPGCPVEYLSAACRPWSDPLNAFAAQHEYKKGTLPVLDDLIDRSSLLSIPPVLSECAIEQIAAEFCRAAAELKLGDPAPAALPR